MLLLTSQTHLTNEWSGRSRGFHDAFWFAWIFFLCEKKLNRRKNTTTLPTHPLMTEQTKCRRDALSCSGFEISTSENENTNEMSRILLMEIIALTITLNQQQLLLLESV